MAVSVQVWPVVSKWSWKTVKAVSKSLVTWSWAKALLYWLIISGGTVAELAFLIGSIWMSLNATVHPFILTFLTEDQTHYLSFLATSAYVALPELIVGLAVVITIGHIRMFIYRHNWVEIIWSILYGIPSIFFAGLSAYTIGESVANINFTMPEPFIVARALAGFSFAFTSLLYWQLGKPQEADRLKQKDQSLLDQQMQSAELFAQLRLEIEENTARFEQQKNAFLQEWARERANKNAELDDLKARLDESQTQQMMLLNAMNKSSEEALQGYSEECLNWLKSGIKTVSAESIMHFTGHSIRRIKGAIKDGNLKVSSRNENLILVSSLIEWLKITPAKTDTEPELYAVK